MSTSRPSTARLAVVFYLLESLASLAGQLLIPGRLIVAGDAAATANNIMANESLFRVAIAAALIAVIFHLVVGVIFYGMFKPVSASFSLIALLILVVACAVQAFAALLQIGALVVLTGHSFGAFSVEQLQAVALMLLNWNGQTYNTYLMFFGMWCIVTGGLIFRSTFLPRILGVLFALAGVGYTTYLYAPLARQLFPYNLALGVGELVLLVYLFAVGVNTRRWTELSAGDTSR